MSDSEGGKLDEFTSRIEEVIGKVGHTLDTDAIVGRFKEAAGQAEGKIDDSKFRQRAAAVDRDKLKGLLDEAQHLGAGAVSLIGTQGEKLADRAPGAFDKLAGAAKERLGSFSGGEGLIDEGQLERFKGQINETITAVSQMAEGRSKDAAATIKSKHDEETRRN